jgi:hypothetical protein
MRLPVSNDGVYARTEEPELTQEPKARESRKEESESKGYYSRKGGKQTSVKSAKLTNTDSKRVSSFTKLYVYVRFSPFAPIPHHIEGY